VPTGRSRRVTVYGEGPDFSRAFNMRVAAVQFLPADDPRNPRAYAVLGSKVRSELFAPPIRWGSPAGRHIAFSRDRRHAPKGQCWASISMTPSTSPPHGRWKCSTARGVMEIHIAYRPGSPVQAVVETSREILVARHGREDFTVTPQQRCWTRWAPCWTC